eukprot:SAG31_NODE_34167_length_335_cov_6.601695_1_plen_69_part_01
MGAGVGADGRVSTTGCIISEQVNIGILHRSGGLRTGPAQSEPPSRLCRCLQMVLVIVSCHEDAWIDERS